MAWEERRGRSYYYRSVREGQRVRKEYVGGGTLGQLLSLHDELERCLRKEEETSWKEEQERLKRSAGFVRELEEAAQILTRAQLLVSGFHKRKGEWRRLRESA
jgi:hypothetical protein